MWVFIFYSSTKNVYYTITSMETKKATTTGMIIGSTIGGLLPLLWGDTNIFSIPALFLTAIGGFLGIWVAFKMVRG